MDNFSRAILASAVSPRQDLTAYLVVLRAAAVAHGAPEDPVSDGGGIFRAKHARADYAALGIRKVGIDRGQAWQNYVETHHSVVRRMADYHVARAATWAARALLPGLQPPTAFRPSGASRGAPLAGRRARLGAGAWCEPADLDRLFLLRATRVLNRGGYLRFRHWRLYRERGLAGERPAVGVDEETLAVEHAVDTLARYRVAYEADGRGLREVDASCLYATGYGSTQPFLPESADVEWHPAQRLAPYRLRHKRGDAGTQERLLALETDAATG